MVAQRGHQGKSARGPGPGGGIFTVLGVLAPWAPAAAHDLGDASAFQSGLLHALVDPRQGLALVALGLWWGRRGHPNAAPGLLGLGLAVLLGSSGPWWGLGVSAPWAWVYPLALVGFGAGSAAHWPRGTADPLGLRTTGEILAGVVLGLGLGLETGDELRGEGALVVGATASGLALGAMAVAFYPSCLADWLQGRGTVGPVVLRVAGSWLAAVGGLLLALMATGA